VNVLAQLNRDALGRWAALLGRARAGKMVQGAEIAVENLEPVRRLRLRPVGTHGGGRSDYPAHSRFSGLQPHS
jgi:hypothetical protein